MISVLNSQIEAHLSAFENKDAYEDNFVQSLKNLSTDLKQTNLPMITDASDLVNYLNTNLSGESSVIKANVRVIDLMDIDYYTGIVRDRANLESKCQIFGNDNNLQDVLEKTKETLDWENPLLITRRICKLKFFNSLENPIDSKGLEIIAALYDNHDGLKINHIYTITCEIIHSLVKDQLNQSKMLKETVAQVGNNQGELEYNNDVPAIKIVDSEAANFHNFYGIYNDLMDRREVKLDTQTEQSRQEIKKTTDVTFAQLNSILKDNLVSKLVLLNLMSNGDKRDTNKEPVDIINLNIFNTPRETVANLETFIQKVLPDYHSLELTAYKLNEKPYYARKNFETNKLEIGSVDLFSGSTLFLDETNLLEGKLVTFGVKNCNFLNELISNQYLPIDYEYSQVKTDVSCPVLCLSKDKSILDFSLKVPYPMESVETGSTEVIDESKMDCETIEAIDYNGIKCLILYCKNISSNFFLSDDDKKMIIEDFIESKKKEEFENWDQLKQLICFTKYLSILKGETQMKFSEYQEAKSILKEVIERQNNYFEKLHNKKEQFKQYAQKQQEKIIEEEEEDELIIV